MKRWYDRFAAIDRGRPHNLQSDNYIDEIYAFFLNCYHLKDWLRNDNAAPTSARKAVEDYVKTSPPLQICADICNSLKHLKRARDPKSKENPSFGGKKFSLELGWEQSPIISIKYDVQLNSGSKDAFKLATECVSHWDTFLTTHTL